MAFDDFLMSNSASSSAQGVTLVEIRKALVNHRVALTSSIPNNAAFQRLTDAIYSVYSGTRDTVGMEESLVYLERIRQGGGGMVDDAKFLRRLGDRIRLGKEEPNVRCGDDDEDFGGGSDVGMESDSMDGAEGGGRFTPDSLDKENSSANQAPSSAGHISTAVKVPALDEVQVLLDAKNVPGPPPMLSPGSPDPRSSPPPPSPPPHQPRTSTAFECLGRSWEQYETEEGWTYYLRDDGWSQWEDPREFGDMIEGGEGGGNEMVEDEMKTAAEAEVATKCEGPDMPAVHPTTPGVPKGRPRRKDEGLTFALRTDDKEGDVAAAPNPNPPPAPTPATQRPDKLNYFKPNDNKRGRIVKGVGKGGYGVVVEAARASTAESTKSSVLRAGSGSAVSKQEVKSSAAAKVLTTPIPELEEMLLKCETAEDRRKKEWTDKAKRRLREYRKKQGGAGGEEEGVKQEEKEEREKRVEEVVEKMKGIRMRVNIGGSRKVGVPRRLKLVQTAGTNNVVKKKGNSAREEVRIRPVSSKIFGLCARFTVLT